MKADKRITINNGIFLRVRPLENGAIEIYHEDKNNASTEPKMLISHGDFVTMLNWYRYQKEIGNTNLTF